MRAGVRRWLLVGIIALVLLVTAVVRPGEAVAQPGPFGWVTRDLWLHAGAYLVLELAVLYAVLGSEGRVAVPVLATPGLVFGYGLLVEGVQLLVPYRAFSGADLLANAVGVLVAVGGYAAGRRFVGRADGTYP